MQGSSIRYQYVEPRPSSKRHRDERLDASTRLRIIEENLTACSVSGHVVTSFVQGSNMSYDNIATSPPITPQRDGRLVNDKPLSTEEKLAACRKSVTSMMPGSSISFNMAPRSAITHMDEGLALDKRLRMEEVLAACSISGRVATSYPSNVSAPSSGMEREPQDLKSLKFAAVNNPYIYRHGNNLRKRMLVGYFSFKL